MKRRRSRGEGTVRKRPDGKFEGYTPGSWRADGKRSKVVRATESEVLAALDALRRRYAAGGGVDASRVPLADYLEDWLASGKDRWSERTYRSYHDTAHQHINPNIGHVPLGDVQGRHVDGMVKAVGKLRRKGEYARAVLSRALNRAVRRKLIPENPVRASDVPTPVRRKIEPPTLEQVRAFLAVVAGHRLEYLYQFILALGVRRGEALGVRWIDVDLDAGTVTISGAVQRTTGKIARGDTKNRRARVLQLPPELVDVLRAQWAKLQVERMHRDWVEHGYVFPSEVGTALEPSNLHRHFKATLKAAGLPLTIRLHDLRHAWATFALAAGVDPRAIADQLGHVKVSFTLNTYTHSSEETQRDAVARVIGKIK